MIARKMESPVVALAKGVPLLCSGMSDVKNDNTNIVNENERTHSFIKQ